MPKRGQRGVCLMFVSNPRNASGCWSKREAGKLGSSQTCHTPYIAYKLWLLHTFCRICLGLAVSESLRAAAAAAWLMLSTFVIRWREKSTRSRGRGKREERGKCIKTCWDLSCHTRRTRQVATRYSRSIWSSSDCSNCIRELAKMPHSKSEFFTPHMPVYLWHRLRLSLRCVEHLSALKCSLSFVPHSWHLLFGLGQFSLRFFVCLSAMQCVRLCIIEVQKSKHASGSNFRCVFTPSLSLSTGKFNPHKYLKSHRTPFILTWPFPPLHPPSTLIAFVSLPHTKRVHIASIEYVRP